MRRRGRVAPPGRVRDRRLTGDVDYADVPPPPRLPADGTGAHRPPVGSRALRTSAWRGHDDVALIVPRPGVAAPTPSEVQAVIDTVARSGVRRLVTGALAPIEQGPFLAVGFELHDRLHLLRHDLVDLPAARPVTARLRRARRADHDAALVVDARAFDPFWRLDRAGLHDAIGATSAARFRVADLARVVGYAVTGRAGDRGYLQRLAVEPEHRGQGLGAALVLDGLRWLRRRHVATAVVNTQVANVGALALYRRLGFVPQPTGLTVLTLVVGDGQ